MKIRIFLTLVISALYFWMLSEPTAPRDIELPDIHIAADVSRVISIHECKSEMLHRGFTHVETIGGALPIAMWTPQGEEVFELIDFNEVREVSEKKGIALRVWTFLTLPPIK